MHFLSAAAGALAAAYSKPKREYVSHDDIFRMDVHWENAISSIPLVGWRWATRGQGVPGYRNLDLFSNQPACTTYVYEIAVYVPGCGWVCVYLGSSDNPREPRYMDYLNDGSHLYIPINAVLSQGLTIWMRRVPMTTAREIESDLLRRYDYAWNQKGQGRDHRRVLNVTRNDPRLLDIVL